MIDLDELHDKMVSYRLVGFTKSDISTIDALEFLGRLKQAEKDAARYRWLRDEARHHMDGGPLVFMTNYDGDPVAYPECGMVLHESYLDEAIDEVMQCSK